MLFGAVWRLIRADRALCKHHTPRVPLHTAGIQRQFIAAVLGRVLLMAVVVSMASIVSFPACAEDDSQKNVLVLNSYHQGYKWTDDITRGIRSTLAEAYPGANVYIEFMDTKRHFSDWYLEKLFEIYEFRYRNVSLDVIISSDDNAFNFLLQNRDELFPGVPIVFCGVNYFDLPDDVKTKGITGVNESADIGKGVELVLSLHPGTKKIYFINDTTTTGNKVHGELLKVIDRFRNDAAFVIIEEMNMADVRDLVAHLHEGEIIFYALFLKDGMGQFYEYDESVSLIADTAAVPMYGTWDFSLGYGIVGGMLTSGYFQGETAARLALRILRGENVDDIPIVAESPNRYMFDYRQVKRFNIPLPRLPAGSIFINKPVTFYSRYRYYVWGAVAAFVVLYLIIALLGVVILTRRHGEAVLLREKERFRIMVESLPVGVAIIGEDGVMKYVNQTCTRLLGYTIADIPDLDTWFERAYPDPAYREKVKTAWYRSKTGDVLKIGGKAAQKSFAVTCRDGTNKEIYFRRVTLEGGDKFAVLDDLSNIRAMEERLALAKRMEAIGTLAGGIAHGFNNLLMGIQGNASLALMESPSDSPLADKLKEIERSVREGAALTRQLLGFAQTGKYDVKPTDINALISYNVSVFSRTKKEVEISEDYDPELWMADVDRVQMEQVILNLFVNAWRAMPQGGTLFIQTANEVLGADRVAPFDLAPGRYIKISIADTGMGMDDETREQIFNPFFTTKEWRGQDAGLGMASVYGIVKNHGGFVDVFSERGVGNKFEIFLPVSQASAVVDESYDSDVETGNETILIVDDEEAIADIMQKMLERLGYRTIVAREGKKAIDIYRTRADDIDGVVLDMIMPGMSGKEVYERLHTINPDLPVVLISGYSEDQVAAEILTTGGAFIQKPVTIHELSHAVRTVLQAKHASSSPSA